MFDLDATWRWPTRPASTRTPTIFPAFKAHGGKLLLYHGWADQAIPPGHTILYYNGVL